MQDPATCKHDKGGRLDPKAGLAICANCGMLLFFKPFKPEVIMNRAQKRAFRKWEKGGFIKATVIRPGKIIIKRERRDEHGKTTGRHDFKSISENGTVENCFF